MAPRDPKRWGQAALGGLLVALGAGLVGASRSRKPGSRQTAPSPAEPPSRAEVPKVRTKPQPEPEPARTQYWPPPPPKPIADTAQGETEAKPVDPQSVALGYERFDAKPGAIVAVMLVSICSIAGAIAVLFYLIGVVHRGDATTGPLTPQQLAVIVPPGPRLQDHPLHDIAMQRKREADLLTFYAWTDPQHRTARIPIARAEALVTGRPLDPLPMAGSAPAGPAAPALPASRP